MTKKNEHTSSDDVLHRLTHHGSRLTRQRQVVLEAIRSCPGHPDAQTIYERARRLMPRISLGTVYRTLRLLQDAGIIQEFQFGKSHRRYEELLRPHHHVICTRCGRVDDVSSTTFDLTAKAKKLTGFEIQEQRLEFHGLCPGCRSQID